MNRETRNPVTQEDLLGCAVACVAFTLGITYSKALTLFKDGEYRVKNTANFYCPELVQILSSQGLVYSYSRINNPDIKVPYRSIVFIKRSRDYPFGHFLCKTDGGWMDSWINFPSNPREAGFRKKLPGRPQYLITPIV